MKIVVVHNFYQQAGGEDAVFADEVNLLQSHDHTVIPYTVTNHAIDGMAPLTVAGKTIWNRQAHDDLQLLLNQQQPDIVHFHNTFPLLSPSVYSAAKSAGAAVVQTLHNYRLLCPNAMFFRDHKPCEDCLGKAIPWPGVLHRCYRGSLTASATVAAMLTVHRARQTYQHAVDAYITLTEFVRDKFIQAGFPPDKLLIKPNFSQETPIVGNGNGNYILYVGRLSEEKGIQTLLNAWKLLTPNIPLKIAGDGDLAPALKTAAAQDPRIQYLGRQPTPEISRLMANAAALIFPSNWYECQPKTIIESFAVGTPVIASNLGSMSTMITPGINGLHFTPASPADLARTIQHALANPQILQNLRSGARAEFLNHYTADRNYDLLMNVYNAALRNRVAIGQS